MVTVGLIRIEGQQVPINNVPKSQRKFLPPAILLYRTGHCELRTLTVRLAGVTGLQEAEMLQKVRDAAAEMAKPEEWTQVDVQRVLKAVGTVGTPKYLECRRVPGKSQVTIRMATGEGPAIQEVKYGTQRSQAHIDLKDALENEAITIPKGMYKLIPVVLAEDSRGLVVMASLLTGELKSIKEKAKEEAGATTAKATKTAASEDQADGNDE